MHRQTCGVRWVRGCVHLVWGARYAHGTYIQLVSESDGWGSLYGESDG